MILTNKIAIVTGASRGIGEAIVLKLASCGATVVINYVGDESLAQGVLDKVVAAGGRGMIYPADVTSFEDVEEMIKQIVATYGRLDIVVNNAGITKDNLMLRLDESSFDEVINVNLKGTFNVCKHVTRPLLKQRAGVIINISSVVGVSGNVGQVNYSASKAGVIGMTKSLAREFASRGIRVNAIAPGFIQSDMTAKLSDEMTDTIKKQIPLGYLGTAQDVANMAAFLASDESRYVTGQVLLVDGGMAI